MDSPSYHNSSARRFPLATRVRGGNPVKFNWLQWMMLPPELRVGDGVDSRGRGIEITAKHSTQ